MKYSIYLGLAFLLFSISCKENLVGLAEDIPGKRDYVWEIDTVSSYYGLNIWGTSASDLRVVTYNPLTYERSIFRYEGKEWVKENLPEDFLPTVVFGLNNFDIWGGSENGNIWHYDGTWKKLNMSGVFINDFCGSADDYLFAAGSERLINGHMIGLLLRYNGSQWQKVKIPEVDMTFTKIKKDTYEGCYYILAEGFDSTGITKNIVFRYDGKEITKIYEEAKGIYTFIDFNDFKGKVLFSIGNKIKKYIQNKFLSITEVKIPAYNFQLSGRNEKDILLSMYGGLAHYNGTDIKFIYESDYPWNIRDFLIFDKEIILTALSYYTDKCLVVKGKLNE